MIRLRRRRVVSEPDREVWRDDPRHLASHLTTVAITVALGLSVFISAPSRFSSPSFLTLRDTPGGMATWGVILLAGGVVLLLAALGSVRTVRVALLLTATLHLALAVTFVQAQASAEGASPWGWILLGGLAIRHVMQALWFGGRT